MSASIFRKDLFAGRVAVVSGGGSGIGKATALELASLGARVLICGRRLERLTQACDDIHAMLGVQADQPRCVFAYALNIRDPAAVKRVLGAMASEHGGQLDYLVNCAGGQFPSPAEGISSKGWNAVVDTNLNGTWWMTQAMHALRADSPAGLAGLAIVSITAEFVNGMPYMAHTGAARAAVDNLTRSLAVEWGPQGVRVNSVAPGIIFSSGMATYPAHVQAQLPTLARQNPTMRAGTESEVAAAVCFLLSPAAAYINGACIRVDGASSLRKTPEFVSFGGESAIAPFHLHGGLEAAYKTVLRSKL